MRFFCLAWQKGIEITLHLVQHAQFMIHNENFEKARDFNILIRS